MVAKNKTILEKVWDFFVSIKLTVFLLIILALASIIGTIIPQNVTTAQYLKIYTHSTYRIFTALDLLDLYHSWWFLALLILLSLNLIACSSRRFPATLRRLRQNKVRLDEGLIKTLPLKEGFSKKSTPEKLKETYLQILGKHVARPVVTHSEEGYHFFSEKGKYSTLGVYLVHLSVLIILLGGILSNFLGLEGYMELMEGETKAGFFLKNSNNFKKLSFSVRCDDFEISYYDNSLQPKDYKSTLTIIDQEKEMLTKTIEVNNPLKYQGINFYQSSYGITSREGEVTLQVIPKQGKGETRKYKLEVGKSFEIEGTNTRVKASRFIPDFIIDGGKATSKSDKLANPAVQLVIFKDNIPQYSTWVFQKYPHFHGKGGGDFDFKFLDFKGRQYTGLQVAKDPGVAVVWLGCTLMLLGIIAAFFISHRRVWLKITLKDKKSLINLAGSSNKNREGFEREFKELARLIKEVDD